MLHGSQEVITRLTQAERLWLFLDYDGTLADFAPTPDDILPDPEVIDILTRLERRPNIRIAVVSGRRLAHIRALLPVPGILLSGTYGVEYLSPAGERIHRLDYNAIRPFLERVKPEWATLIERRRGYYLEDKGWTLAIHARLADDQEANQILAQARQIATKDMPSDTFRLLGGHKFLEIGPKLANKGSTIDFLLSNYSWRGSLPVYLGDDDKDEEAFAVINQHNGVSILVSAQSRDTSAELRLDSPATVHRWLKTLKTQ